MPAIVYFLVRGHHCTVVAPDYILFVTDKSLFYVANFLRRYEGDCEVIAMLRACNVLEIVKRAKRTDAPDIDVIDLTSDNPRVDVSDIRKMVCGRRTSGELTVQI